MAAPLRVLMVGCGNMADGFDRGAPAGAPPLTHAGAYAAHGGFRLDACVDPQQAAREAFMQRWRVPQGYGDLGEVQEAPGTFDVVSICSPTTAHARDLELALRLRPRAIFCEKPVTPSLAQTQHWVQACRAAGVLLAVNHTRRWAPDVQRLQRELASGQWGPLRAIAGFYNKGILNNGGHLVDLVQMLAGPLEVLAAGPAVHDHWPDDPTVSALLRTAQGVPVTLAGGHAGDYALFELQLVLGHGVLMMENGGMHWRLRRSAESPHFAGYRSLGPGRDSAGEYPLAMGAAVANLHDALVHGAALASTGDSALAAQRVCEQIRLAATAASTQS